jgi:hypothetical protein
MSKAPELDAAYRAIKAKKWAIALLNHLNDKSSDEKPLLPNQYNSRL